jgi:hypothetical protein
MSDSLEEIVAKPMTPERARTVLEKIAKLRANYAKQIELLAELEATVASQVGTRHEVWAGRYYYEHARAVRCSRCNTGIGTPYTEEAVEFDGKWWHAFNCKPKETT